MKTKIKKFLSEIVYSLYKYKVLKNRIKVQSMDETIDELLNTNKSLVRFGDGEISVLKGNNITFQQSSNEISEGLKRIISYSYEGLIVALPPVFNGVELYKAQSRSFWKEHLLTARKTYNCFCNNQKVYGNAFFSRFYYAYKDKLICGEWITKIKLLWKDKDIVIVEGTTSHNGVGNDLFEGVKSIERILCPSVNAMQVYDEIVDACKLYSKEFLFLLSVGITAKFLAEELYLNDYRVIDIGNLDMEYEWYLRKADGKMKIEKYDLVSYESNAEAGYIEYLEQIKVRIEEKKND